MRILLLQVSKGDWRKGVVIGVMFCVLIGVNQWSYAQVSKKDAITKSKSDKTEHPKKRKSTGKTKKKVSSKHHEIIHHSDNDKLGQEVKDAKNKQKEMK